MATTFNGSDAKSLAPEITAEWTVHAQLKLSHQGSSTSCDKPVADSGGGGAGVVSSGADIIPTDGTPCGEKTGDSSVPSSSQRPPVKVVYKFSSADSSHGSAGTNNTSPNGDGSGSVPTVKNVTSTAAGTHPAASAQSSNGVITHSVSTGGEGQNFLAPPQLFPKCTSTCSIVLTADLVPNPGGGDPIISVHKCASTSNVFNTADKCTSFPEKFKSYEAKHVSCQTSDIELSVDKTVQTSGDDLRTAQKKPPEVLPPATTSRREEKYSSLTRKSSTSPAKIVSPSNTLQSSHRSSVKEDKKKPRTVHIDVYCTGSDAESSSSDESSVRSSTSSSSSGSRFDTSHLLEMKKSNSNVTHPTIYESEEMKLRHKRAARHEVPRRLQQQTVDQSTLSTIGSLRKSIQHPHRRLLKRSNTKEEINESKKILFSKIFGDQKEVKSFSDADCVRRDASDDTVSSGYPFSSRSTKRDITGSSLSSALAYAEYEDTGEMLDEAAGGSLLKVPSGTNVTHSDSFEYENSEDRYRINQMERVWSLQTWKSPSVERRLLELHNPKRRQNSDSDNNCSESDHSFVYDSPTRPHESNHSLNEYSDSSPSTVKSCSNRASSNADSSKRILQQALLNANTSATFPPRSRSPIEGYTSEYLALARRFGSLISGRRKPGVHMGPVRNPECQCEHCRRWMVERDGAGVRERALSVDDIACNIVDMRKQLHLRNQAALP